jgi:hypothetical protein
MNKLIASVISYSFLLDNSISLANFIILLLNLYTHKFAKFHTFSSGFSIISKAKLELLSCLKIPYFSGLFTPFTKTQ